MVHQRNFVTVFFWHTLTVMIGAYGAVSSPSPVTTPSTDRYVPVDSDANITYTCTAQASGESAIWEVNNTTQILQDGQFRHFESLGVYIEPSNTNSNISSITISRRARNDHGLKQLQCHSFQNFAVKSGGSIRYIITYYPPAKPIDLTLEPSLMLEWSRPSNVPLEVPVNYTVEINATERDEMNFRNFTSDTFLSVHFLEELLHGLGSECIEFVFFVSATNDAGTSPFATVQDTVPISPDVRTISRYMRVTGIDLLSQTVQIMFPPVTPCSYNFSLTNYTINIDGAVHRVLHPSDVTEEMTLSITNLTLDASFSLTVTACNHVTCRTSESRTLYTSDVQNASVIFFDNNIFLSCSLADAVAGRGCVFNFSLVNSLELFYVARDDSSKVITQCNVSSSQNAAYTSFEVMDWESDGSLGELRLPISPRPPDIELEEDYTQLTNCVVPRLGGLSVGPGGLSGGAVAGIVLAILVVLVVAIAIVVAVLVYRIRTVKWLKLKQKDKEKVTVDFDLSLLMADEEPSGPMASIMKKLSVKRSYSTNIKLEVSDVVDGPGRIGVYTGEVDSNPPSIDSNVVAKMQEERKIATEQAGETEVGVAEVGMTEEREAEEGGAEASFVHIPSLKPDASLVPHHAAILAGTQTPLSSITPSISPQAESLAAPLSSMDFSIISPNAAFTLDIVDEKRVRLHLNRGLIRRVLEQNKVRALERRARANIKKPRGTERSDSRPLLSLALTSEVRVADVEDYVVIQES